MGQPFPKRASSLSLSLSLSWDAASVASVLVAPSSARSISSCGGAGSAAHKFRSRPISSPQQQLLHIGGRERRDGAVRP